MNDDADDDLDWFRSHMAKQNETNEIAFAAAKEEAAGMGKEPFDLDQLDQYRTSAPVYESAEERQSYANGFERQYYSHRGVMTLKEFGEFLDQVETAKF